MATKLFEFINFLYIFPYCPGWEYSSGLHYKKVNETHTDLHSTCLISPPDFFIPSAAGMHYCDLLSPFRCHKLSHRYPLKTLPRALEWIYIVALQGKSL